MFVYFYLTAPPPTKQKTTLEFGTNTPLDHILIILRKKNRKTAMSRRFSHIFLLFLFFLDDLLTGQNLILNVFLRWIRI